MELLAVYKELFKKFGPQGWWPIARSSCSQQERASRRELKLPIFEPPEWEVCLGAILTQNTAWSNVEKALDNLKAEKFLRLDDIINLKDSDLEKAIRPSGFYRQKAKRLKTFSRFVLGFKSFRDFSEKITRDNLLELNGIGPETADSILLYACSRPVFVIDAYTKRFYSRFYSRNISDYNELQEIFQNNLPKDVDIYKEFHALIVELSKMFCRKKPACSECPLSKKCSQFISQKSPDTAKA